MKNEKEILIRCIYLITLTLHKDSEILQQVLFVLGFLLHNDSFLAAIAALYLGSSLTDWLTDSLTDGSNIRAECHNSVNFQART